MNNKEVAQFYLLCFGGADAYLRIAQRLEESEISLSDFFGKNGSFDSVNIEGIGKKTKSFLNALFSEGKEEVYSAIKKNEERRMCQRVSIGIKTHSPLLQEEKPY